jgi:hypothetical protein
LTEMNAATERLWPCGGPVSCQERSTIRSGDIHHASTASFARVNQVEARHSFRRLHSGVRRRLPLIVLSSRGPLFRSTLLVKSNGKDGQCLALSGFKVALHVRGIDKRSWLVDVNLTKGRMTGSERPGPRATRKKQSSFIWRSPPSVAASYTPLTDGCTR